VWEKERDRERQQAKDSKREQERKKETRGIAMRDIVREHDGEESSKETTPVGTA